MSDMDETTVEDPQPATLSQRLEDLAQSRPTGAMRDQLQEASEDAAELEHDVARLGQQLEAAKLAAEAHRVERVKLEQRVVDTEEKVEALEARVVETDTWRTDAEEELEGAKLEAATLAAEVQRLEGESQPFGQRRSAWEAAAGERTSADSLEAVLTAAQWIAEGVAVVELQDVDEDSVADWLLGKVIEVDVRQPDGGESFQQVGLVVQSVRIGTEHGADLRLRGPIGELDDDGRVKRP